MKSAHRFPGIALATAVASLGGGIAAADESIYFSELPVVASVSRLPQRLADAPTAVTVIDRDMIKASGVRDLNDVFRLVPGFQTYPHTTEPARVSYHGLNDEDYSPRVQVLIDGRSMYSPLFGNGVNWATIPVALDDIERIEVVRGTNSVSYGSNAFLGVINIITVDPALTRGLSVSVSHGSQNVRDQALRLGGQIGEVGDFRLTYRQLNDDALADRGDWIDNFRSRLVDFRADMALDERNALQINAGQAEGGPVSVAWAVAPFVASRPIRFAACSRGIPLHKLRGDMWPLRHRISSCVMPIQLIARMTLFRLIFGA